MRGKGFDGYNLSDSAKHLLNCFSVSGICVMPDISYVLSLKHCSFADIIQELETKQLLTKRRNPYVLSKLGKKWLVENQLTVSNSAENT